VVVVVVVEAATEEATEVEAEAAVAELREWPIARDGRLSAMRSWMDMDACAAGGAAGCSSVAWRSRTAGNSKDLSWFTVNCKAAVILLYNLQKNCKALPLGSRKNQDLYKTLNQILQNVTLGLVVKTRIFTIRYPWLNRKN
jgi:hypothetical protein